MGMQVRFPFRVRSAVAISVLALLLVPAPPAALGAEGRRGAVTKTFELALHGDVPPGTAFALGYASTEYLGPEPGLGGLVAHTFCGRTGLGGAVACTGGASYRVSVELPRGARLGYYFVHFPRGDMGRGEVFNTNLRRDPDRRGRLRFDAGELEVQTRDSAATAVYRFPPARGERGLPGLPETGGGGAPPTASCVACSLPLSSSRASDNSYVAPPLPVLCEVSP